MNRKSNKTSVALLVTLIAISMSSCQGNSAKKAIDIARKYTGKTVNGAKKAHLEKYANDAARVRFVKNQMFFLSCDRRSRIFYL